MFDLKNKLKGYDVILASQSPRRKELLSLICDSFKIIPAEGEEAYSDDILTEDIPVQLALGKCREIAEKNPDSLVIGCDTVVALGEKIMGKPVDIQHAFEMLSQLSGRTHRVISGVSIYFNGEYHNFANITEVEFKKLTADDIKAYIATGEPSDKAGAYGIQGQGCMLVNAVRGDYFNVVGLPVSQLADELDKLLY